MFQTSNLIRMALFLSLIVITLGAFTRLKDAGLGCPDWPGCYGQILAPYSAQSLKWLQATYHLLPIDTAKAWIEMIHRYLAGTLGALILMIAVKNQIAPEPRLSPTLTATLLLMVIFQALLGMWTVTLKLHPVVVMSHLIFGFLTLSLVWWLNLKMKYALRTTEAPLGKIFPFFALLTLFLQIVLGGWTSTNYAALACPDFPTCQHVWLPMLNFKAAFNPFLQNAPTYEFGILDNIARITIHFTHRVGALFVLFVVGTLGYKALSVLREDVRSAGKTVLLLLFIQIGLGIGNIQSHLALPIAVLHNLGAALLLMSVLRLICVNFYER